MLILCFCIFNCSLSDAKNVEKIGVLYSYENVESYGINDIVGFYQLWKPFLETFQETYLDYQFLCNISPETKVDDLGVRVIFFPLAISISQDERDFLNKFIDTGGKLIITGGVGPISGSLKTFLAEHGIIISENIIAKRTLNLKHKLDDVYFELPSGNFYSTFEISGPGKKIFGRWKENDEVAIGGNKSLVYIGYSWGQDIDKSNDIKAFLKTLDYFWDGISSRLAREITIDEYKKISTEISKIKEEANSVIQITEQLDLPVPKYQLRKHFDDGNNLFKSFNSNYLFENYLLARENADAAKNEFAIVYSLGIPVKKVEVRAIWLDRGTIVSMKDAFELANLIKNIARLGFNVIFFETINAGYPIYPSKLLPQNPLVNNWDPLKVAVEAAHAYGVELHAWVWTFAVGNTRHNLLIGQPVQYPGPIVSSKGRSWALTSARGALRIEMQPENWISPANKKACAFLTELFSEIIRNYDVDGLQLDYIRFPFQQTYSQVGFDFVSKNAFQETTGKLPQLEGPVNKIWTEWKIKIVSDFVRDLSGELKKIKPKLKISAAVFGIDRSLRLRIIQQDWESWLLNKWVDAVYPFYYSYTKDEIKAKLEREKEIVNHGAVIIPAFNLRVLNIGEFAERITLARNSGVLGVALFAAEHLNDLKKDLLKIGPFREQAFIPYNKPLLACQQLLEEFSSVIDKFAVTKTLSILADSQTQKDVFYLTKELKNDFKNFTPDKTEEIEKKIINLQLKVKDWLSLEKYLKREQRALYISTYLDQVRTLLNYMKNRN
ncbi:MAG: family 10 glycosylhydrolase [Candidatus Melainabacteria bacterium]|nr:family 10 glycosylhydrolase [Candidatus Melainabacteria bacterium]